MGEIVLKVERRNKKNQSNFVSPQHQQSISATEVLIIAEENKKQSELTLMVFSEFSENLFVLLLLDWKWL